MPPSPEGDLIDGGTGAARGLLVSRTTTAPMAGAASLSWLLVGVVFLVAVRESPADGGTRHARAGTRAGVTDLDGLGGLEGGGVEGAVDDLGGDAEQGRSGAPGVGA